MLMVHNPRLKVDKYSSKTSLATSCLHVSKGEIFRVRVSHQQAAVWQVPSLAFALGFNVSVVHPFPLSWSPVVAMSASLGGPTPSVPRTLTHVCVKVNAPPPLVCSKRTASLPHCSLLQLTSQWHFRSLSVVLELDSLTEALQSCRGTGSVYLLSVFFLEYFSLLSLCR